MSTHLHRNLSSKFMIVCSINSTTSQTALNLGRSKLVSIETNKINFDRKKIMMLMKFKLHQEETLPEHQKKFSHKKKLWYAWSITRRVLNLPGLRFGRASYVNAGWYILKLWILKNIQLLFTVSLPPLNKALF